MSNLLLVPWDEYRLRCCWPGRKDAHWTDNMFNRSKPNDRARCLQLYRLWAPNDAYCDGQFVIDVKINGHWELDSILTEEDLND